MTANDTGARSSEPINQTRPLPCEEEWHEHRVDYIGLCASCGEERSQTEPDARQYPCESCGLSAVFGAEAYAFEGCTWLDANGRTIITSWDGLWS